MVSDRLSAVYGGLLTIVPARSAFTKILKWKPPALAVGRKFEIAVRRLSLQKNNK